ncbi:hypothetical protein F4810DRAFT_684167, partial [Camillea tinctor]
MACMKKHRQQFLEILEDIDERNKQSLQDGKTSPKELSSLYTVKFTLAWDVFAYSKQQYDQEYSESLFETVAISGDDTYVEATNISEYMECTWGHAGVDFLKSLKCLLNNGYGAIYEDVLSSETSETSKTKIAAEIYPGTTFFEVTGEKPGLVGVVEPLLWVSTALRNDMQTDPCGLPCYYSAELHDKTVPETPSKTCEMEQLPELARTAYISVTYNKTDTRPKYPKGSGSWQRLFSSPLIVEGYPIKPRQLEQPGLEVSLSFKEFYAAKDRLKFDHCRDGYVSWRAVSKKEPTKRNPIRRNSAPAELLTELPRADPRHII